MQLAKEEFGESTPGKYLEKESWWWNDAVRQAVSEKRRLFREWQRTREENDQKRYKDANKECKRVVAIPKENAYSQLYDELKGKEGGKKIYKLANAKKRMATDIGRVTAVKDKDGTLLTGDDEVGLHQGSALSPLLFVIIIDVITEEIEEGTPSGALTMGPLGPGPQAPELQGAPNYQQHFF